MSLALPEDELRLVLKAIGPAGVATLALTATFWRDLLRFWRANQRYVTLPVPRPGSRALRVIGRHYMQLSELDASGCYLNNEDVLFVVAHCPLLQKLDLSGCPFRDVSPLGAGASQYSHGLTAGVNDNKLTDELRDSVDAIRPGVELVYRDTKIEIMVVTQDGNELFFNIGLHMRLRRLIDAFCQRQGISDSDECRFLFDGQRVYPDASAQQYDMEDGDVIDVMVAQYCIAAPIPATFGAHAGTPGAHFLSEPGALAAASPADAAALARAVGGDAALEPTALPRSYPKLELLDKSECAALIAYADAQHSAAPADDLRLTLSLARLVSLVGVAAVARLADFFGRDGAGCADTIKLRRVAARGDWVAFHTDYSRRTMQVALNGEGEYDGGRLTFAHVAFEQPPRPAGSATIHTDATVHGVTALRAGTRYGLFLCQIRQPTAVSSAAEATAIPAPEGAASVDSAATAATAAATATAATAATHPYSSRPASPASLVGLEHLHAAVAAHFDFLERAVPLLDCVRDERELETFAHAYLHEAPALATRISGQLESTAPCRCPTSVLAHTPEPLCSAAHRPRHPTPGEDHSPEGGSKGGSPEGNAGQMDLGVELMWRTHMLSPLHYLQAAIHPRASSRRVPDLVAAVKAQHDSMRHMLALRPRLSSRDAIEAAVREYGCFLSRQCGTDTVHFPSLTTDLVWHAHMTMCPECYGDDCRRVAGHFVNHETD